MRIGCGKNFKMFVMQIKLRDLKPEVCSDIAELILTVGSALTCLSAVLLTTTGKHHRAIADTVVAQLISLILFVQKRVMLKQK